MSWYDFGKTKDNFMAYLPDGKKPIDTGFYFHELMALGGWYFAPISGSGQRRFYNRLYINPPKKEIEQFNLDQRASMFIQLGKSKFGELAIKITDNDLKWAEHKDYAYTYDELKLMFKKEMEIRTIIGNWQAYYDYIARKVVKSYIVLYVGGRNHTGEMFKTLDAAMDRGIELSRLLSANNVKKYGIQIFEPHKETPYIDTLTGVLQ